MTYCSVDAPTWAPQFVSDVAPPACDEPDVEDMCADPIFLAVLKRDGISVPEFLALMRHAQLALRA